MLSAPPVTYTRLTLPPSAAKVAACPLSPTGSGVVALHEIVDGLKAAFCVTVKVSESLVPSAVTTRTGPGTVVTMNVLVQSAAVAMTAVSAPPPLFANSTTLDPWVAPKFDPWRITVLPVGPDGLSAPFTLFKTGGPLGPAGPPPPPPQAANPTATIAAATAARVPRSIPAPGNALAKKDAGAEAR